MSKSTPMRKPKPPALTAEQENMLSAVSEDAPSKLNHFRKAYEGFSLRSAITAKCLECTSFETKAIRDCAGTACPLHNVRPYQEVRTHNPEKAKSASDTAEVGNEDTSAS
jgi:hypothetical protein